MDANFDYKYRVNGVIEDLEGIGDCIPNDANFDAANRRWTVGDGNPVDVFESCAPCAGGEAPLPEPPVAGNCAPAPDADRLVMKLDLRAYAGVVETVKLNGSLWGWDPALGPEGVDPDGDGIYTIAFAGLVDANFDYKYRINGVIEDLEGIGDCIPNDANFDAANRRWNVGDGNPVDVFESCEPCR